MTTKFFTSKLAKKTFLFLILAAITPLAIIIAVTYMQFNDMVTQGNKDQLKNVAKENALLIYGKLSFSKQLLHNISRQSETTENSYLQLYFSALGEFFPDGSHRILWDQIDDQVFDQIHQHPDKQLWLIPANDHTDIYLSAQNGLIGRLNPVYLWDETTTVLNAHPCVFDSHYRPIMCQQYRNTEYWRNTVQKAEQNQDEIFLWDNQGQPMMSYFWTLFMGHEFNTDNWIIAATRPVNEQTTAVRSFRTIYFSVIGLAILMVVFLGSVLIRKNLDVITQLIQGTRNIIQGNFASQIEVPGEDEFSELALAFNSMSNSLNRSAREYAAFATIDRSILESVSAEKIIAAIFDSLHEIAPFDDLMMINLTRKNNELASLYWQSSSKARIQSMTQEISDCNILKQFAHDELGYYSGTDPNIQPLLASWQPSSDSLCVIPVTRQDRLLALFFAPLQTTEHIDSAITSQLLNFSQRTAVALYALEREAIFRHMARYDSLTDIPNRVTLMNIFNDTFQLSSTRRKYGAFLFIDLDRFKNVNDSYGHLVGDSLLTSVATRITGLLKNHETVARLSGDEFAVILAEPTEVQAIDRVQHLSNAIIATISVPFQIVEHSLHVGASIGIALIPQHSHDFADALRCADTAMYASKKRGGNCFTLYKTEMSDFQIKRTILERNLRSAIDQRDITIFYQPKVFSSDHRISGFEALLRWNDPIYGAVSPFEVVTLAEEIGLIVNLGNLILELAVEQWQQWKQFGYQPGTLAVNVSPLQLLSDEFIPTLTRALASCPALKAAELQLEITEGVMVHNASKVMDTLADIRRHGVKIAIDDFGTGYSSLSYLIDIPADILKIDRSFVTKIENEAKPAALLGAVISLGHNLGYEIVAEGVETEQQAEFLKYCQVEQLQGYLFSKALPASEVEDRLLKKPPVRWF